MGLPIDRHARFETTRWSLVRALGETEVSTARDALAILCQIYWYPLYAYVRRQGHPVEDAQDLTQAFFVQLLERNDLARLREEGGRLRSYLLGALRHFLFNQAAHRQAVKRGGGLVMVPLDPEEGEHRYSSEVLRAEVSPEDAYEYRWAMTVIARVLATVEAQWNSAGRRPRFDLVKDCVVGEVPEGGYKAIALEAGMTPNAVAVAVHRLRAAFRRELRDAVADTVVSEDDVEAEIGRLIEALSRAL